MKKKILWKWMKNKVEKILEGSLDSIASPSLFTRKFAWGAKAERRLLSVVFKSKKFDGFTQQVNFPPIIWIFTEGDWIKSRLYSKIFSTLRNIWIIPKSGRSYPTNVSTPESCNFTTCRTKWNDCCHCFFNAKSDSIWFCLYGNCTWKHTS